MSSEQRKNKVDRAPCGRCMTLRFFILGTLSLIVLWLVSPDSVELIGQVTPLQAALCAVGALAFIAIVKSLFEWIEMRNSEDSSE